MPIKIIIVVLSVASTVVALFFRWLDKNIGDLNDTTHEDF